MDWAVDPWDISFQEHQSGAQIQSPPTSSTPAMVVPGCPLTAGSAPAPTGPPRPDMSDDDLCCFIELDILDHRVLDAQHRAP